jgi:hypothetical protein
MTLFVVGLWWLALATLLALLVDAYTLRSLIDTLFIKKSHLGDIESAPVYFHS